MNTRFCRECGEREDRASYACIMSDDGESPHLWTQPKPAIPTRELPFLQRVGEHLAQGVQER